MQTVLKIIAVVLITAVLNLQIPLVALAAQGASADRADGITKHQPEMAATAEVSLPGSKKWLWWVLGALLVGGVAAAAGGGGGAAAGGASAGSVTVAW